MSAQRSAGGRTSAKGQTQETSRRKSRKRAGPRLSDKGTGPISKKAIDALAPRALRKAVKQRAR